MRYNNIHHLPLFSGLSHFVRVIVVLELALEFLDDYQNPASTSFQYLSKRIEFVVSYR